ncbi:MAG: VWA domain-containing protein [Halieaceae bacterium]|nr:VWA domain-containing protein [Halieaceae bacterium]
MPSRLVSFINVLRSHDVRISPAETLDAVQVITTLGYEDRNQLRSGLSLALAKTAEEKVTFHRCFDQFFSYQLPQSIEQQATEQEAANSEGDAIPGADPSDLEAAEAALQQMDGEGGETRLDLEGELASDPELAGQLDVPIMDMLRNDDRNSLALAIARAGDEVGLPEIQMFTQKGQFTRRILDELGEGHIRSAIVDLENRGSDALGELQAYRDRLRELVRDHVEREYLLHAQGRNQQFMDDVLAKARLSHIEHHYLHRVQDLVRRMAKKLAARHSRRRKVTRRGQLNMAKTLRRGIAHEGVLFNLYWKSTRKQRPQILAVCDVSGSVSAYAKFLLMFLYSLYDVLPRVRSFAFSNRLGEVSELFAQHPVEKAVELVNWQYGGATDYGSSLMDFAQLALDDIDSQTTVIILGDARNNNGDPRLDVMQSIYARSKQVIWLNPESRALWGSGDSEMPRYLSCCHFAAECSSLAHLERIVDRLLRSSS